MKGYVVLYFVFIHFHKIYIGHISTTLCLYESLYLSLTYHIKTVQYVHSSIDLPRFHFFKINLLTCNYIFLAKNRKQKYSFTEYKICCNENDLLSF